MLFAGGNIRHCASTIASWLCVVMALIAGLMLAIIMLLVRALNVHFSHRFRVKP
jgi:hypothetical protein